MPEAGSLATSGVAASSAAVMPDRRRAHGCPGATTTVSVSCPAGLAVRPGGRSGPSTNPMSAFGGWLMPVVPPMVSAATGALLVPYAGGGQARLTLLLGCYAMFGISLPASVIIIPLVWSRLVTHKTLPAVLVPTCWIVLGPLGQSVAAAGSLARVAGLVLPRPYPAGADVFALLYGVPVWGFAMLWLAIAAALTVRAARGGLPFGLTWWSFTFPVGTCVAGTIALAARTGSEVLRGAAGALFLLLAAAWLVVAARTCYESARGRLFLPLFTAR